jgi:hypothetical protein
MRKRLPSVSIVSNSILNRILSTSFNPKAKFRGVVPSIVYQDKQVNKGIKRYDETHQKDYNYLHLQFKDESHSVLDRVCDANTKHKIVRTAFGSASQNRKTLKKTGLVSERCRTNEWRHVFDSIPNTQWRPTPGLLVTCILNSWLMYAEFGQESYNITHCCFDSKHNT